MAIVGLPADGEVSYGQYTFDGAFHVSCREQFEWDDAGRTILFTRFVFVVEAVIADGVNGSDLEMAAIQDILSRPGLRFVFRQKGLGKAIIAGPGGIADTNFGPKPRILTWEPIGTSRACVVRWQVEVCLSRCSTSVAGGVLAINYEIHVDLDQHGNTSRTISGFIQIANARVGVLIARSPDRYRNWIVGPVPLGFRRTQNYRIDAAKTRLYFTVRDQEIGSNNAFPPLVTEITGQHRTRWSRRTAGRIHNYMSFRVHARADTSPVTSYLTALTFVIQRIKRAKQRYQKMTLIDEVDISEDLFGRVTTMSVSWTMFGPLKDLIQESGLWQPLTNDNGQPLDWNIWRTSMSALGHHPYGNARWGFTETDDIIVDLCNQYRPQINAEVNVYRPGFATILGGYANDCPLPQDSYIDYHMAIVVWYENMTVSHKILQKPDAPTGVEDMLINVPGRMGNTNSKLIRHVIQQTAGTYWIILSGWAERVCYPIPKPVIKKFGGQDVKEVKFVYKPTVSSNAAGVPVFKATWIGIYTLEKPPGEIFPAGNPIIGLGPAGTVGDGIPETVRPGTGGIISGGIQ